MHRSKLFRLVVLTALSALCITGLPFASAQGPAKKAAAKDVYIMKGAPTGGVRLEHKLHAETRDIKCVVCHHASKPEKPNKSAEQPCADCHTKTVAPPMKTKLQAAFHNPKATEGLCIDCHKKPAKGKPGPTKCLECHKKSNV